jgi:Amt family ammonium transporter
LQQRVSFTQHPSYQSSHLAVKFWVRIDDSMDNLAEHGIAGMVGLLFNGFFAADYIIGLDGVSTGIINGGGLNGNWKQVYIQIAYIVACTAYSFIVSAAIAFGVNLIPGLKLRASEDAELLGMDDDQLGEFAYDYVEVRRDYLAWTPEHGDFDETNGNAGVDTKVDGERMGLRSPMSDSGLIMGQANDIEMNKVTNGELRSRPVTSASRNA